MGAARVVSVRIGDLAGVPPALSVVEALQAAATRLLGRTTAAANQRPADLALTVATTGSVLTLQAWEADLRAGRAAGEAALAAIGAVVAGG